MKRRWLMLASFAVLVLASACSGGEKEETAPVIADKPKQTAANEKDTEKENAKEPVDDTDYSKYQTEEAEERVQLEPGKYSGDNYDEEKVKSAIDQFPEGKTAEEYYYRMLALMAEDYRPFYETFNSMDTSYEDASAEPGEMNQPEGKELNVQILFDASGSMAAQIGGEQMMKLAKDAVKDFASGLPENTNVSLRVYGHKGTGSDADKELSCSSTEEVYPFSPYNETEFMKALDQFSPAGWTPLGASLESAYDDLLSRSGENVENIVYVVSDGVETCDGDPVAAAKKLNESDIKAMVNIIGFDVDNEGQQALKKVAEAGKGKYSTVRSKQEFADFFRKEKSRLLNEWYAWQSENVNKNYDSQGKRVDLMYETEREMIALVHAEEGRLLDLSGPVAEKYEVDMYDIRRLIRDNGYALREYARKTAYHYRDELRTKGYENREEIRDKGYEERQKLRGRRE